MDKPVKTNAMRMLEKAGRVFQVVSYEVDEEDLSGVRGAQILMDPQVLIEFIGAEVANIAR